MKRMKINKKRPGLAHFIYKKQIGHHCLTLQPEAEMEEGGPQERQILKFLKWDRLFHELPIWIYRKELKDELVWIREEIVILEYVCQLFKTSLGYPALPGMIQNRY